MTYPQARQTFEAVLDLDPGCAMAHWGIAMTLFQPLWPTRPSPEALQRGWQAVQEAKKLGLQTEQERLFVAAAEAFFLAPSSSDYWARIRRWEAATARLYAAFPEDTEAAAFYALAHLAAAPADATARDHADRAAAILLHLYEKNPEHPGVMHYLVHANDTPGREKESLEITRKYDAIAPENPHALHMPTHIYTRLGDWQASIRGNLRAAEAALRYPAGDQGQFVWDEFPHALEYLVYAALQRGDDDAAAAYLERLRRTADLEPTFKTAFHLSSMPARFVLERRAWGEAAQLVPRALHGLDWDRFTWPEAITHFARGLGLVRLGNIDAATAAAARLEALETATVQAGEELFARNIRVLRLDLEAWLAEARGQPAEALALMQTAAALEAATPKHAVTPAPTLPAGELLGDLLMKQGEAQKALAAYEDSMRRYPRRFHTLLGAAQAAHAAGEESRSRRYYGELLAMAEGSRRPVLAEARRRVAQQR